jgi:hypothetical protein
MRSDDEGMQRKRSWRGFIVRPKSQFTTIMAILGVGILMMSLLMGYLIHEVDALTDYLRTVSPDLAGYVEANLNPALNVVLAGQALLWIASIFVGFLVSHRIYGPIVSIQRHIANLRSGNYSSRVHLRKEDEFQELARDLNELAQHFETRAR